MKKKKQTKEFKPVAIETNAHKVAKLLGWEYGMLSDGSGSWVSIRGDNNEISLNFSGDGMIYEGVSVSEFKRQIVSEDVIIRI